DFVQMHYVISNRTDSDFWRANTVNPILSDVLAERLAMWRVNSPKKSDFFSRFDIFDVDNYLHVLYGMKYQTVPRSMTQREESLYRSELERVGRLASQVPQKLIGHRDWLSRFMSAYQKSLG